MQKWVIIGIIVSVTIAVGVIVWADQRRTLPVIPAEQQLITKEKAVDIATKNIISCRVILNQNLGF